MTQPFWSPAYKKPLVYGFGSGFLVLGGLLMGVKHIALAEDAKLSRGWPVSGRYVSDTSLGRRNSWATKIGEKYVVCAGSAFGGKTDCPNTFEGKQVTATRVAMPSFVDDQLVIAELKEGPTVLYSLSDSELIETWEWRSFKLSLFYSFFVGLVVGVAFAILSTLKSSENK
ncbi:hypothetical protein [Polaromonas sp.]|uniref:hypothetical protein n=1 Tax=Polaromonas sp. TaxID=1869339 RepID=UPI002FC70438